MSVDQHWALQDHGIHSAAVDVYEIDPLPADSTLTGVENLTFTPHLAADNFAATVMRTFDNIARTSRGEPVVKTDSVVD